MISKNDMLRIRACAFIYIDEKPTKLQEIADSMETDIETAGICYVIGSIKRLKARGIVRSYAEGIERIEREQSGDRASVIAPPSAVSRDVSRLNGMTASMPDIVNGAMVVLDETAKADTPKRKHTHNVGKIIGTMYVQWGEKEEDYNPDKLMVTHVKEQMQMEIDMHIRAYYADFVSRLSRTARKSLHAVITSGYTVHELMTATIGERKALRNKAEYIYNGFPARDSVTAPEFVSMARDYMTEGDIMALVA